MIQSKSAATTPLANKPSPFWSAQLIVLCLASVVTGLSYGAVNIALPRLAEAFSVDVSVISWVSLVQSLLMPGLMLPFGWLADRVGYRKMYIIGTAIFAAGTLFSAFAPAFLPLLGMRVIATIGSSIPTAIGGAIAFSVIPSDRRGQALGMVTTSHYVGSSLGPTIGGLSMIWFDWPGPFLIGAPMLVAVIFAYLRWIPEDRREGPNPVGGFDWQGSVLLVLGIGGLILILNNGTAWGWTSASTLVAMATGFIATGAFVYRETHAQTPLLNLSLFQNRSFTFASLSVVFAYVGGWGPQILAPFYLIDGRGLGTAEAGLILGILPVMTMIMSTVAGTLADRIQPRILTGIGTGSIAAGIFIMAIAPVSAPLAAFTVCLGIIGIGIGLFSSPTTMIMLTSVGPTQRGTASAVNATARNIGIGSGIAIASSVYSAYLNANGVDSFGDAMRLALWILGGISLVGVLTAFLIGSTGKK